MVDGPAGPAAACLPVAIEIMTAYTDSAQDPAFFWTSVQRVMADGASRADPASAMAELVLGMATLCGIALDHLADRSAAGTGPRDVLSAIQRAYVAGPGGAAGPGQPI